MTNSNDNVYRINQRRKKRAKKQKRNWLVKIISIAVLVYLLLAIIFSFRSTLSTTIALNGIVEEEIMVDGYVFRDQHIINSPANGYLEAWVDEGARVSKDQVICNIYTGEYDPDLSQQIRTLNQEIFKLKTDMDAKTTFEGNSVLVEQKIALAARDASDLARKQDMSVVADKKEELNLLFNKKKMVNAGGSINKEEELAELENKLLDLEANTGGSKFEIKADIPGVFSSRIDSLEDKLMLDAAKTVTPAYLAELEQSAPDKSHGVVQNEPVCKIVNNYEWYFAATVDASYSENLKVGQKVNLRFFDMSDTSISGTISHISAEEKGKVAITVYTNKYVDGIYSKSMASAEIITASAEGIKLPAKSLHVVNEKTGVYVLRLDVARFVPVNVHYKNADWAIVSPAGDSSTEYRLQIYDEVIVDAKNLEDGKVVR